MEDLEIDVFTKSESDDRRDIEEETQSSGSKLLGVWRSIIKNINSGVGGIDLDTKLEKNHRKQVKDLEFTSVSQILNNKF